ncbi:hypothetical protein KVT40_006434 [Elsinoe batatas]|uniref:Uncharacterized protein n=1 Tax=Elsinoe batatas TaxID=2601811 RepID=A0A8K0L5A7_9PEZI|nr:hypothetical protein KVT40_006434 [Elsinoe batatas]
MADHPSAAARIAAQWRNPQDIFSLLLLIGGDVVQKAIARLSHTGCAVIRLMPKPENEVLVGNCDTGYIRSNNSWILGRILRDREHIPDTLDKSNHPPSEIPDGSTGIVSLAIEVFIAEDDDLQKPHYGLIWWLSWALIALQHGIAAIPAMLNNDWSIVVVTSFGSFLAVLTSSLPQWKMEKWPGRRLRKDERKPIILTRGNGHQYVMLILSHSGVHDLEATAAGRLHVLPHTALVLAVMTSFWIVLLIAATGPTENTWYLIWIGALGMLQHVYLAWSATSAADYNIPLRSHHSIPVICGYQLTYERKRALQASWSTWSKRQAAEEFAHPLPTENVRGVMGALMEVEKLQKNAGATLLRLFFPGGIAYEPASLSCPREKLFWEHATNL